MTLPLLLLDTCCWDWFVLSLFPVQCGHGRWCHESMQLVSFIYKYAIYHYKHKLLSLHIAHKCMKRQLEIYSYIIYNVDDGEDEKMCEFVVYLSNNKKLAKHKMLYPKNIRAWFGSVQLPSHPFILFIRLS